MLSLDEQQAQCTTDKQEVMTISGPLMLSLLHFALP